MEYRYTAEQFRKLEGLAYRIADNAYMIERYGRDGAEMELTQNHKTLLMIFDELDRAGVPFWVQNSVIAWAENWRLYKSSYLDSHLKTLNICAA